MLPGSSLHTYDPVYSHKAARKQHKQNSNIQPSLHTKKTRIKTSGTPIQQLNATHMCISHK